MDRPGQAEPALERLGRCGHCGYELDGVPGVGRAVRCPECGCVDSLDPELSTALVGDEGPTREVRRYNRWLWAIGMFLGIALLIFGLLPGATWVAFVGIALLAAILTVSFRKPQWFR